VYDLQKMSHVSSFHFYTHLASFYRIAKSLLIFVELFDKHAGFDHVILEFNQSEEKNQSQVSNFDSSKSQFQSLI